MRIVGLVIMGVAILALAFWIGWRKDGGDRGC